MVARAERLALRLGRPRLLWLLLAGGAAFVAVALLTAVLLSNVDVVKRQPGADVSLHDTGGTALRLRLQGSREWPTTTLKPMLSCVAKAESAKNALSRTHTEACRQQVMTTICHAQNGTLFPVEYDYSPRDECFQNVREVEGGPLVRKHVRWPRALTYNATSLLPRQPPVRIFFYIVVHGRGFRQIVRLFRAIFSQAHVYLFHVDESSEYLYQELSTFLTDFDNALVAPFRMATIWGAANLYEMYLRGIDLLRNEPWDYLVNLSGADFPLQPLSSLEGWLQLAAAHRVSFLHTYGSSRDRFISRQGLDKIFVLCDRHMYRLGERNIPEGMRIEGGSDWFMLHRSLALFAAGDDQLVLQLRAFFDHTLLSAESYFHVVAANSRFCGLVINSNMRFANWKRTYGCQCQYKAFVDWCGCSPNVFRSRDSYTLLHKSEHNFFARKFDGRISQRAISTVETRLLRLPSLLTPNHYWESVYKGHVSQCKALPGPCAYFAAMQRRMQQVLQEQHLFDNVEENSFELVEAFALFVDDAFHGYVARAASGKLIVEAFFRYKPQQSAAGLVSIKPTKLSEGPDAVSPRGLGIGSAWDPKEEAFLLFGQLLSTRDEVVVAATIEAGPSARFVVEMHLPGQTDPHRSTLLVPRKRPSGVVPFPSCKDCGGIWTARLIDPSGTVVAAAQVLVVDETDMAAVDLALQSEYRLESVCHNNIAASTQLPAQATGVSFDTCNAETSLWSTLHPRSFISPSDII